MDPERSRFVIVGAGFAGAATAWHLARAGCTDAVVLEREPLAGVHASGRNAAMVRSQMEDPALQPLADESAAVLRQGTLADYRAVGGLMLGWGDEDVSAHVPCARGRGAFRAEDGVVDIAALLQSYLRGRDVRYGCELTSFHADEHGVLVETSRGAFRAEVLVNAAGPWAGALVDLPLTPLSRTLFVSEPDRAIDPSWPFLWDTEHEYYLRPESGGWLLCACDEVASEPGDYTIHETALEDLSAKLRAHQPGVGDLRIMRAWSGQRTFAPDRRPVIGFDPRSPRLFHVAALGGHGVTLSWSIGRIAAEALLGLQDAPAAFDPGRLPATRSTPAQLLP